MSELPRLYVKFRDENPEIAEAYEKLGGEVHGAGPLDEKTRALTTLGWPRMHAAWTWANDVLEGESG
jgi:hypothetical protein